MTLHKIGLFLIVAFGVGALLSWIAETYGRPDCDPCQDTTEIR